MANIEIKGIQVPGGFALKSGQPLDAREVVSTIDDLGNLVKDFIAYQGMIVYVSTGDEKGLYVCESIDNDGS